MVEMVRFDDVEIGDSGQSRRRTITESDIMEFAGLVGGDYHPMHIDSAEAQEFGLLDRIAQGNLLFIISDHFIIDEYPALTYGFDSLRFVNHAYIGDTVYVQWEVTDKEIHDENLGKFTINVELLNQDDCVILAYKWIKIARRI